MNHEDRKDHKEKMLAHLAAEQLDRVMDREEVVRPIVDSKVPRIKDGIQCMIWRER